MTNKEWIGFGVCALNIIVVTMQLVMAAYTVKFKVLAIIMGLLVAAGVFILYWCF